MTAETLSAIAGVLLSLALAYFPGLSEKFAALAGPQKRLLMLGLLILAACGSYGLACLGWFSVPVSCDQAGVQTLITAFISALVANQSTYSLAVRPKAKTAI